MIEDAEKKNLIAPGKVCSIVIALKLLDIIVSIRCLNFLNFSNLFIHVILDDFDRAHIW
jgi:hypothetical protein